MHTPVHTSNLASGGNVAGNAIRHRLDGRRRLLVAHLDMLLEQEARTGRMDVAQLDLIHSEMKFLADLHRTIVVLDIRERAPTAKEGPTCVR